MLLSSEKKSITRFGDGEINWLLNNDFYTFQKNNELLSNALAKVITSENDNLCICLPDQINHLKESNCRARKFWLSFFYNNFNKFKKYLYTNVTYGNADVTRCYMIKENKNATSDYFYKWKTVFKDRKILIVEGENTLFGIGSDLLENTSEIKRILCPNKNAFDFINEILDFINIVKDDFDLCLLALGPTATILAYELSSTNLQAIDIGHLDVEYIWYKNNCTRKCPIQYKTVFESTKDLSEEIKIDFDKETYQKQIIAKIGIN